MTRPNVLANSTPLFCDLYHLTMAQAWFIDGKANETKTSECFFRKCPFKGSYLLSAGLAEFAEWLENHGIRCIQGAADERFRTEAEEGNGAMKEDITMIGKKKSKVFLNPHPKSSQNKGIPCIGDAYPKTF